MFKKLFFSNYRILFFSFCKPNLYEKITYSVLCTLSFIFLFNFTITAQESRSLFTYHLTELAELTVDEVLYLEKVRNRLFVADVKVVSIGDIFALQENGYVRFTFGEGDIRNVLIETLDIQYDAPDNYRYKGIVRDSEGLSIGELILNRLPAGFAGDFRMYDEAYEILPLN